MNLVKPRSMVEPVMHDTEDRIGGKLIHHWDGSQDAVVLARPITTMIINPDNLTPKQRDILMKGVRGGAFNTASGMYALNLLDVLDASQTAFDWITNTAAMKMYTNSIAAMSYYADTLITAAPYNANEVTGTGYSAYTLPNRTCIQSPNGTIKLDSDDAVWTITGSLAAAAFGGVIYAITTPANWLICAIYLGSGSGYNVTNGTLTVQLSSLGINTLLVAA